MGAMYGGVLGIVMFVSTRIVPQPAGSIVLWIGICVQLSWCAVINRRRTSMPFATAAMIAGAVMSLCLAVLAASGHPYSDLRPESWIILGGGGAIAPLLLFIESRVNPAKWRQCARYLDRSSVWGIFLGRHIPDLRG